MSVRERSAGRQPARRTPEERAAEVVCVDPDQAAEASRRDAMGFLHDAIGVLEDLIRSNPHDTVGLVRTWRLLEDVNRDIKLVREEAKRLAIDSMPTKTVDVDGVRWKRTATPKRIYDPEGVERWLTIVVERAIAKALEDSTDPVRGVIHTLRSVLLKTEPKITAMRAYHVDPDDISTVEWSNPSLKPEPLVDTQSTPKQLEGAS